MDVMRLRLLAERHRAMGASLALQRFCLEVAFVIVLFDPAWATLKQTLGPCSALALNRMLVAAQSKPRLTGAAWWTPERLHLLIGGRQCATDMLLQLACVVGHVLFPPIVDKSKQGDLGMTLPVGAIPPGVDATEHVHPDKLSEPFTHST